MPEGLMSHKSDSLFCANVRAGLILLPLGLIGGLVMSLWSFHPIVKGMWAYDDLPRRLLRLGHIAAVMLPLINIVVGPYVRGRLASHLLIWGAVGLPLALAAEAFVPALRPLHPSGLPAIAFTLGTLRVAADAIFATRSCHSAYKIICRASRGSSPSPLRRPAASAASSAIRIRSAPPSSLATPPPSSTG
ncbi:MAG TPA: hypothetical protein VF950_07430 [Planctomycetota bacterium]